MQWSGNKYIKKQIHQGSTISQGKIKNIYQLWKFMNIRLHVCGHIHSTEFMNGYIGQDDNSSTVQIMVIFVSLGSLAFGLL